MSVLKQMKIPKNRIHIQCSCEGDHYLQFLKFERDISTNTKELEMDELYVTLGVSGMGFWKDRLRAAWGVIRHGEYENHGVLASREDLEKLVKYLDDVLTYWDLNYEKDGK